MPLIRAATAADVPAVVAAYAWLFAPPGAAPPDWDPEIAATRVQQTIDGEASTVLVADDLSGFGTVYLDLVSVRYGLRAWVEDLAVDPERRSTGVGKALLDGARGWAADRGATHLKLESADARKDAHRFYERERPSGTSRAFNWTL